MARLAAFIVLLIPGLIAAGGIKIMRDSLFGLSIFSSDSIAQTVSSGFVLPIWLQFLLGLIMFVAGLWFFAGFLLHRDRKNGRVQKKFITKKGP